MQKRVHLIGIGGTGLSAIARVLLESGWAVTGSDRLLSPLAEGLQAAGVHVFVGHQAENVHGADLVVRSSAIPDDNPEVQEAQRLGIPVLKRSDFLGQLMAGKVGIAVAGSHGKTTTTAMISWMLTYLEQDPSYIIGGVSLNLGVNAHAGSGPVFVIEADEYDRMFLGLQPKIGVVTNVEHDHPDCYPTAEEFYQAFVQFAERILPDGVMLACRQDAGATRLMSEMVAQGKRVLGYGWETRAEALDPSVHAYQAENLMPNASGGYTFDMRYSLGDELELCPAVALSVPGEHNVLNALAAMAVAHQLGLPLDQACLALETYRGTGRRFEIRGEIDGITVIDDYAHHPTEVRATLAAARSRFPRRVLWVVWQPHTYSRTRALMDSFATAFDQADHILVTEVYAAREKSPEDGFSARQVVELMPHANKHFLPGLEQAATYLSHQLQAGDVLLVLSAGDADQISAHVLTALQERSHSYV
jgi:UDP-N-acetylmuramate--alanine ligase